TGPPSRPAWSDPRSRAPAGRWAGRRTRRSRARTGPRAARRPAQPQTWSLRRLHDRARPGELERKFAVQRLALHDAAHAAARGEHAEPAAPERQDLEPARGHLDRDRRQGDETERRDRIAELAVRRNGER